VTRAVAALLESSGEAPPTKRRAGEASPWGPGAEVHDEAVAAACAGGGPPVACEKMTSLYRPTSSVLLAGMIGLSSCSSRSEAATPGSLALHSSAFASMAAIPVRFTCEGADVSPPLSWTGLPEGTESLVLIVDDPDAPDPAKPKRTWVHWLLYNIPASATGLPEAVSAEQLPPGTKQGRNDWQRGDYGGPCPPIGRHRYFFKLYALDRTLTGLHDPDKAALVKAMQGHILGKTELIGTYKKMKP